MVDAVSVVDTAGAVRFVSPSLVRLLGRKPEDRIGRSSFEFVHPDDLDRVRAAFEEVVRSGESSAPTSYRCRHADGEWRVLESVGRRCEDQAGAIVVLIGSRTVPVRARTSVSTGLQRPNAIEADLTELLAVLTRSIGSLESAQADASQTVRPIVERARFLFNQLLLFSRLERTSDTETSDVNERIEALSERISGMCGAGIEAAYLLGATSARVSLGTAAFDALLLPIAAYARSAMPEGGRMTFVTRTVTASPESPVGSASEQVAIECTYVARDTSAANGAYELLASSAPGSLEAGLHTVFHIAGQAGGHVAIDSEIGVGTTIRVLLPVVSNMNGSRG